MKILRGFIVGGIITITAIAGLSTTVGAQAAISTGPYISDFTIDYHLGRDNERRSTLTVTEKITVEFPVNQNKGIVREIPRNYDGHSVHVTLDSVTRNGQAEPIYNQYTKGDLMVIETGTDDYIDGTQVFEFTYHMRDVTRFFANSNADEFYWDTNGTGWRASISNLSVNVTIDEELRVALNGNTACYQGSYGQDTRCELQKTDQGFSLTTTDLAPGQNASIAIGFAPGTFAEYEPTLFERLMAIWVIVTAITTVIGIAVLIWLLVRTHRKKYRSSELSTIVPEYLPPKNASIATSAAVLPGRMTSLAAQLTDLAVRHYVEIIETRAKSTWRAAAYDIKVIRDVGTLRTEEQEVLTDMFGHRPSVGEKMALQSLKNNDAAVARFQDNTKKVQNLMRHSYGLEQIDEVGRHWFGKAAKIILVPAIITLAPALLVAALVAFIISKVLWTLSDEGLALRRYLAGLELYIKVAEQERLRMLQSPEGAAKVLVDANDPAQIVKLYERVLPYAVLFGQEKEWSKRLGDYYATTHSSPDWYSGQTAFNAAMFGSMMSNFSSSASATSTSSSSSGGSSGGGFSGGGGGGGGGGFR